MAILSFNGRVNIAVGIVKELYPASKFYQADGIATGGPSTDPANINQLTVVFQDGNGSVFIKETGYGEFAKPQHFDAPVGDDYVIDWPIQMDLPRATELKNAAGYTQPFSNVTLRWPMMPEKTNPFFTFGVNQFQPYINVDTVTGKVSVAGTGDGDEQSKD